MEIQNARGIMDVFSEMLNAIDPGNREVFSAFCHLLYAIICCLGCCRKLHIWIFHFRCGSFLYEKMDIYSHFRVHSAEFIWEVLILSLKSYF
jgi:hypothetical protein